MNPTRRIVPLAAVLALLLLAAGSAAADWPQFRHDEAHTGVGDQPGVVKAPYEPWTFEADGPVVSSPATAPVDGQRLTIVGSYPGQGLPGTLYAVDADGAEVWSAQPLDVDGGYISSPTVEDVDGDGDEEVAVATLDDGTLRLFDAATGDQEWSDQVGSTGEDLMASSPTITDVTGGGADEIVVGGSADDQAGTVFVYAGDGTQLQALELDGPAWSSPLVADVDGDGDEEVVLATGVPDRLQDLFPNAKTGGRSLYAFETGSSGLTQAWNVTLDGPTLASPVAADPDADGTTEVLVGDQAGTLWAVNGTDGSVDASEGVVDMFAGLSSPVVEDLDGDGDDEIALGSYRGAYMLNLTEPDAEGFQLEGELVLPKAGENEDQDPWVGASLAIQDVDGDGVRDLVGMTVPVNVTDPILESDAVPGRVFAVNATALDAGGGTVSLSEAGLWSVGFPDDGGLSGPTLADVDGDGDSEILAGEGVPLVGNGSALHAIDAANPTVDGITTDPDEPTDLDDVTFTAEVRDEDTALDDLSYRWELGDGNTSNATNPTHEYGDDGTYPVNVTVTDPDGHVWNASRSLEVRNVPPSLDPVAETEPDDLNVTFHAGASDPDGSVESVEWTLGDGTTATGETVDHEYETGGTYTVNVTATDDDGDTTSAEFPVSVNRWPSVDGPDNTTVQENETLTWNLTWDDPDGDALADVTIANASGAEATWNETHVQVNWTVPYDVANRSDPEVLRRVDVTVLDDATPQGNATDPYNVTVENVNRAPEVGDPNRTTVHAGTTSEIEGNLSDPDGNDMTLDGSGLPPNATLSQEPDAWVLTVDPGLIDETKTYDVNVTADDGVDNTTTSFTLTIEPNQPPDPVVTQDKPVVNATTVWDPTSLTLDASGTTDPEGHDLVRFSWFDPVLPGGSVEGDTVDVSFPEGGTYNLSLEVEDEHGAVGTEGVTVPVDDALTGDVDVREGDPGPAERVVVVTVTRANGTPVAGADVEVTVEHVDVPGVSSTKNATTGTDGVARVSFQGDAGTPAFLPGRHRVDADVEAPSASGAVIDDVETVGMVDRFYVGSAEDLLGS